MKKFKALILALILSMLFSFPVFAGELTFPFFCWYDSSGYPLASGKLYSYVSGTSTEKLLYSDKATTTPHTNPEILDTNGCTEIYGLGTYTLTLKDSTDTTTYFSIDGVVAGGQGGQVSYYYPNYAAVDNCATGNSDTIKYAIDTCSADNCTIVLQHNSGSATTTYKCSSSETIPANINLIIENGAIIADDVSNAALTINGTLDAGRYQIFNWGNGTGAMSIGSLVDEIYPEWWGAITTGAGFSEALQAASIGAVVSLTNSKYTIDTALTLKKGVSIVGTHVPASDNTAYAAGGGSIMNRTADIIMLTAQGTHRTTDRVGHNLIQGVALESDDISTADLFYAKYADVIVFRDVTFWQDEDPTNSGHSINVEECWDWRFVNVTWKHYGDSGGTKYALNIYNGADNNSNDFQFIHSRWQEGQSNAIYFDSSGGGNRNTSFYFTQCKFEDARSGANRKALTFISGSASRVFIDQSQFSGCTERHIHQTTGAGNSNSQEWFIDQSYFTSLGDTPTESIYLEGDNNSITNSHFRDEGTGLDQWINFAATATNSVITGNNRENLVGATEVLDETDFATHVEWDVTGQWDDSGGNAALVFAGGAIGGTLQQVNADQATNVEASTLYQLQYTAAVTTAPDGDFTLVLTGGAGEIPNASVNLDFTAGTKRIVFMTHASGATADFTITAAETTATQGSITIDDISLKKALPIVGGTIDASNRIGRNGNYITEYSGTADIVSGDTEVIVFHNAAYVVTNTHVQITMVDGNGPGSATKWWIKNVGSESFTIVVDQDPGETITFAWWLTRVRG